MSAAPLAYSRTEPKKGETYFYQGRPVTVMKVATDGTYLVRSWNVSRKLDTWVEREELRG